MVDERSVAEQTLIGLFVWIALCLATALVQQLHAIIQPDISCSQCVFLILCFVFILHQSSSPPKPLRQVSHLFLHEVKAHGEQGEAEHEPQRADDLFGATMPCVDTMTRNHVTKSDRTQRYKAEIQRRHCVPCLFPKVK